MPLDARPVARAGDDRELQQAFAQAEAITRQHSRTFHAATALLRPEPRRAIRALYGFCRTTDDLVDRAGASLEDVEAWRAQVRRPADQQTLPVLRCWAHVREQYAVDPSYEMELIDGVALDIRHRRCETWAELERYCYLVASTVGLLSIPIVGLAPGVRFEQAAPFAIRLGVALQLTNILRDVGEDARRGRVYLPLADLDRFGLTAADILGGVQDDRFVSLIRFEIERARGLYQQALPGIALLAPSARPAVGAAALLYRAILDEIEALDYRVQTQRAYTSGWQKVSLLPSIFWTVATLRAPNGAPGTQPAASA